MVNKKGKNQSNGNSVEKSVEPEINAYSSWLMNHPSALENFKEMMKEANGKNIVVFLDYDGTLSNIVPDPDQAIISASMRRAINKTAFFFPTAIVTGRTREKVFEFVKLKSCYYAGSHGLDISTRSGSWKHSNDKHQTKSLDDEGNEICIYHPAQEYINGIQKLKKALEVVAKDIEGSMVEDNKYCVSVHYRNVPNEMDVDILKESVENVLKSYPDFHISLGKMVMEIRPSIDWDKGRALEYLLETFGFNTSDEKVFPVYIGDDKTDEDAFKIIRKMGRGLPIVVTSTPKETLAEHSLKDPSEVKAFLIQLVNWKKYDPPAKP